MGRQEQRLASRNGIDPHKPVANRPEMVALLGGEIEEANRLAGIDERVLTNEILDFSFGFVIERVIGGAHVREFRGAAASRDRSPGQQ